MAKHLNELLDIINASDPEAGEDFLKLLQPEKLDRYEMGSLMEATLGNDLTSYYDKKEISDYLTLIENHELIADDLKEFIRSNREEIIKDCYDDYDSTRPVFTHGAVDGYLEERFGYNVSEIIGDEDLAPYINDDGKICFTSTSSDDSDEVEVDEDYSDDDEDEYDD